MCTGLKLKEGIFVTEKPEDYDDQNVWKCMSRDVPRGDCIWEINAFRRYTESGEDYGVFNMFIKTYKQSFLGKGGIGREVEYSDSLEQILAKIDLYGVQNEIFSEGLTDETMACLTGIDTLVISERNLWNVGFKYNPFVPQSGTDACIDKPQLSAAEPLAMT